MQAVVLLSGGLDSVVSMLMAQDIVDIKLALTFDYGQKASAQEIRTSRQICEKYNIMHKVVSLPFMLEIDSGLNTNEKVAESNPWVPNRNGLFINIAATYAENVGADWVLCGFNREEALEFADNSVDFVNSINQSLYYSTRNHVQVKSMVLEMDKVEIIHEAQKRGVDFTQIWSCYRGSDSPCGECSSCKRQMAAFEKAGLKYI